MEIENTINEQIKPSLWHMYVIETVDHLLYTGITTDVKRRVKDHLSLGARAAKFFRAHKPERLVFSKLIGTHSEALKAEYKFKLLKKDKKWKMIFARQE
jgi:putative endonuclease